MLDEGTEVPRPMNGEEYPESLRDGREIRIWQCRTNDSSKKISSSGYAEQAY